MLPFLEVSHLPSSSSFHSAVLQPLGLQYISDPGSESPSAGCDGPCITYGASLPPVPVFKLRQVGNPKPSSIVLSAQSPTAVTDFHRCALRANTGILPSASPAVNSGESGRVGTRRSSAKVVDFDGNTMEVVYRPPPPEHGSRYGGPTVRKTQSTSAEASRILDWNYGVAVSSPAAVVRSREEPAPRRARQDEPYRSLGRAVTTSPVVYGTAPSPRQNSSGLSTGAVVGTLLGMAAGAAAGAALTYTMVKSDRARAPRQELDTPAFTRRSTYPNAPCPTGRSPRYVEVERAVERARYPQDYAPVDSRRSPPEYIARYSQVGSTRGSTREVEALHDDTRSHHRSRNSGSVRTRSEAATARRPLLITETAHRSYVGSSASKHGNTPPITRSTIQRSHTYDVSDRDSYASARSQRSHSTVRPAPAPASSPQLARSRTGSRLTTSTVKVPGQGQVPRAHSFSRAGSYMSARNVPLPASAVGSSHVGWDSDDRSIVPDDSISCVGSRRGG